MARNLGSPMLAGISSNAIRQGFLVDLTLASGVAHVWSGVGSLSWNGNTYLGVGSLGEVGEVKEGVAVKADGTSIALSGIDSTLLNDCLNDIKLGAPVTIWFALLSDGAILGSPYPLFVGTVDKPLVSVAPDTIGIALALENRMSNLQRAGQRRYTSSDQRYFYPDDIGFSWVEILNDIALNWG